MSDDGGLVGAVFALLAIVVVVAVVIWLTLYILLPAGALYGAGISLRNYGLAFRQNVRLERAAA